MGRTACKQPQCLYKGALYLYLWQIYPKRQADPDKPHPDKWSSTVLYTTYLQVPYFILHYTLAQKNFLEEV
jgi:hypothetical protein